METTNRKISYFYNYPSEIPAATCFSASAQPVVQQDPQFTLEAMLITEDCFPALRLRRAR